MKHLLRLSFLLGILFVISCEKDTDVINNPVENEQQVEIIDTQKETRISIALTDDPVDADHVFVDLKGVDLYIDDEIVNPEVNEGIYDLLDYQGTVDTMLTSSVIDGEWLHLIRLVLGENNTVVVDGETHDLFIPSSAQAGLKIIVDYDLTQLDTLPLIIDFDAEASIKEVGDGKYILKPVLKVVGDHEHDHDDDDDDDEEDEGDDDEGEDDDDDDEDDDDEEDDDEDDDEDEGDDDDDDYDDDEWGDDDWGIEESDFYALYEMLETTYEGYEIEYLKPVTFCFTDMLYIALELEMEDENDEDFYMHIIVNLDGEEVGTFYKLNENSAPDALVDFLNTNYDGFTWDKKSYAYTINGTTYYDIDFKQGDANDIVLNEALEIICE